eukprot:COSAG01_NODE_5748_length_4061_cov_8.928067_3_plen_154_part_00
MGWLGRGIQLTFSSIGDVINNTVHDVAGHGIQFWCNWNFKIQACHTLRFTSNYVRNARGGANIWGTGGVGVVMSGNDVASAGDVALDCEWCTDVMIVSNAVRDGHNAGISLFLSCRDVLIADNVVWLYENTSDQTGLGCELCHLPPAIYAHPN